MLTPAILIPTYSKILGKPTWLSPVPRCVSYKGEAFFADPISYRAADGRVWYVPPGLPTDGGSYPFFVFWWGRFDKETRRSFGLHDMRYPCHDYCNNWPDTRAQIDKDMRDGLRLEAPSRARLCYAGVRLGGAGVYNHKSRRAGAIAAWLIACENGQSAINEFVKSLGEDYF